MTNAMTSNGFKETEIGPIPVNWEIARLQEAATFTRKPRGLDLSKYDAIPFIPMELVPDDGTRIGQYELRPGENIRSGTYCEKGDILLAKITPSFENGKQGIIGEIPLNFAYATTEVYPIRGKPGHLDQMFLFYFLKLSHVRADIAGKMEGSTGRQRVPRVVIENYPIPLPPLPEQRRIAHVLGTIQQAIAAQDELIAAAREVKRSLMQRLFTYGPGPTPVPTKETQIGDIPEHWEVVRLGDVLQTTQYGLSVRADRTGKYPMLRMNNLDDGRIDASDLKYVNLGKDDFAKFHVRKRDVLFNRTNSYELVGKTAIFDIEGDFVFASYLIRVVPDSAQLLPECLNYYLNWDDAQRRLKMLATRGVSQSNISATKLKRFAVGLPSIAEQGEIARKLSVTDRKIEAEEQRKAALQALFKTMLHRLMTGRVRV
jgi:type I restriction enzyme S subunit